MARGVNKVILIGNLGQDPEARYTPSGSAVCNVPLATTSTWKDRESGEKREKTEWHRLVFFGRLAEITAEYLHKGSQAYVEGRLQTRKWEDQSGTDRYTTEVIVSEMYILGSRSNGSARYDNHKGASKSGSQPASSAASSSPGSGGGKPQQPDTANDDFDDDIPF